MINIYTKAKIRNPLQDPADLPEMHIMKKLGQITEEADKTNYSCFSYFGFRSC